MGVRRRRQKSTEKLPRGIATVSEDAALANTRTDTHTHTHMLIYVTRLLIKMTKVEAIIVIKNIQERTKREKTAEKYTHAAELVFVFYILFLRSRARGSAKKVAIAARVYGPGTVCGKIVGRLFSAA